MYLRIVLKSHNDAFEDSPEQATAEILRGIAGQIERGVIHGTPNDINGQKAGETWSFVRRTEEQLQDDDDDENARVSGIVRNLPRTVCARLLNAVSIEVYGEESTDELREAVAVNIQDGTIPEGDI